MIGKRKKQVSLFDVGNVYSLTLDPRSFHGQLARAAGRLFPDEGFRELYHERLGRPSVPPSQMMLLTLLQHEARVSDEETIARSAYDLRWCAVLGKTAGEPICVKSTLQLFRAHLVLHAQAREILKKSLDEARRAGLLKSGPLRVSIDTMPMVGAGAVKDTYNLVGGAIWRVIRAVAKSEGIAARIWAEQHELARYVPGPDRSLKGSLDVDWSDEAARQAALTQIVDDGIRTYRLADAVAARLDEKQARSIREAQILLGELLLQDVEVKTLPDGTGKAALKQGTQRDRIPSATDPDQRHGHKSKAKRFTGHKSRTAVDVETQLIVDVDVLPGNAGDAEELVEQAKQVETNTGEAVAAVLGDCAMGAGETRAAFAELKTELLAKVPAEHQNGGLYPKSRFTIDLETVTVTCPAGHCTDDCTQTWDKKLVFRFGPMCAGCPLRAECTKSPQGRTIHVHPQEALLRAARELQRTPEGRRMLRERLASEHRQARLAQLGCKQARYLGHRKSLLQLAVAATIANLRWTWNWAQALSDGFGRGQCVSVTG